MGGDQSTQIIAEVTLPKIPQTQRDRRPRCANRANGRHEKQGDNLTASTIIVALSDTHVGSTTAIAPPKFEVHSGRDGDNETNITEANRYQKLLYSWWIDFWRYAAELAGVRGKTRKRRLILLHLGDCIDGLHHHTPQVMIETADQIKAAFDLLRPAVELADGGTWITYGTGAHVGQVAESEVTLARMLGERVHHG